MTGNGGTGEPFIDPAERLNTLEMQEKCEYKLEDVEKIVRDFNYVK